MVSTAQDRNWSGQENKVWDPNIFCYQESGSGTDDAKLDDEMEVNVDNPKVGADTVKPEDEMEVAGNINQELSPDSCAANNKKLFSVTLEIKVNFRKNGSETSKNDPEKSSN